MSWDVWHGCTDGRMCGSSRRVCERWQHIYLYVVGARHVALECDFTHKTGSYREFVSGGSARCPNQSNWHLTPPVEWITWCMYQRWQNSSPTYFPPLPPIYICLKVQWGGKYRTKQHYIVKYASRRLILYNYMCVGFWLQVKKIKTVGLTSFPDMTELYRYLVYLWMRIMAQICELVTPQLRNYRFSPSEYQRYLVQRLVLTVRQLLTASHDCFT